MFNYTSYTILQTLTKLVATVIRNNECEAHMAFNNKLMSAKHTLFKKDHLRCT